MGQYSILCASGTVLGQGLLFFCIDKRQKAFEDFLGNPLLILNWPYSTSGWLAIIMREN